MVSIQKHKIYGIIGSSLKHSLSPLIHNYLYKKHRLDNFFTTFEIKQSQLKETINSIKTLNISGVSVTFPFKKNIIPYLDKLDATSLKAGAVNTIKNTRGKLIGYNTDIIGVQKTIQNKLKINIKDKTVILLGAGGAARACLIELIQQKPYNIIVAIRDVAKVEAMIDKISKPKNVTKIKAVDINKLNSTDIPNRPELLINSTSANSSVLLHIIKILIKSDKLYGTKIFDLNYGSRAIPESRRDFPNKYVDGLYMLIAQAAASFHIWTGIRVKPDDIYKQISKIIRDNKYA